MPLNAVASVATPVGAGELNVPGAGAGKESTLPVVWFVGLNVPLTSVGPSGSWLAAASSKLRFTLLTAVVLPA